MITGSRRAFRTFMWGRGVSLVGTVMAPVALTFAVLEIAPTSHAIGLVLAARTGGLAGAVMFGGALADRYSRRSILWLTAVASGTSQAAVVVLLMSGNASVWQLAVLEAINGALVGLALPTQQSIIPDLLEPESVQRGNALLSAIRSSLFVAGPAVASLISVGVGPQWALAADSLSYFAAALLFRQLPDAARSPEHESSGWVDTLRQGWAEFTSRRWVWTVVASMGGINLLFAGAWMTVAPVLTTTKFSMATWGIALSAEAVGFVGMAIALMRRQLKQPLQTGMCGAAALCLPMFALGRLETAWVFVLAAMLAGAGLELCSAGWQLALMTHIPSQSLGRVSAYDSLFSYAGAPIGALAAAATSGIVSAQTVVLTLGVLVAASALAPLLLREVRLIAAPGISEGSAAVDAAT